jgi:apolipoprotein D and lipocalin family protein
MRRAGRFGTTVQAAMADYAAGMTKHFPVLGAALSALGLLGACSASAPLPTVAHVDLERFMGDWYVIANIPTFIERGAHNAVESYALNPDGTIATTFSFRAGGFDGALKQYHPTGYVEDDGSNAIWGMQFIWPIKAEYLIVSLDADYTQTVVARNQRDYVWIMARTPTMPEADYQRLVAQLGAWGYDAGAIQRVPQRWSTSPDAR